MRYHCIARVTLKQGLLDPQGKAIEDALPHMGWGNVTKVRVGKVIEFDLDAEDEASAIAQMDEMGTRLFSNPVIEEVSVRWSRPLSSASAAALQENTAE